MEGCWASAFEALWIFGDPNIVVAVIEMLCLPATILVTRFVEGFSLSFALGLLQFGLWIIVVVLHFLHPNVVVALIEMLFS